MNNSYAATRTLKALKKAGFNQSELAKKFGITKGAVHQWKIYGIPHQYCDEMVSILPTLDKKKIRPNDWQKYWPE